MRRDVTVSVAEAAHALVKRGTLGRRRKNQAEWVIGYLRQLIARPIPVDLADFYRENIDWIGDFTTTIPVWNDHVGRVTDKGCIDWLLPGQAIPIFWDGCGNLFGVDIARVTDHPAVYFFDKADSWEKPAYAAGSSIGTFLLLLAEHDIAIEEKRPPKWELSIDPDLGMCSRAPPIWHAR
jgi:hypothetical protein